MLIIHYIYMIVHILDVYAFFYYGEKLYDPYVTKSQRAHYVVYFYIS